MTYFLRLEEKTLQTPQGYFYVGLHSKRISGQISAKCEYIAIISVSDENHGISKWSVNLGIGTSADKTGIQMADITDEVKFNHTKAHFPERLEEGYNPYEDEAYVRRRLKVSANDANFDMEWASVYLRRLDKKTLYYGDPYMHRLTGQGYEKGNMTQEPIQLK